MFAKNVVYLLARVSWSGVLKIVSNLLIWLVKNATNLWSGAISSGGRLHIIRTISMSILLNLSLVMNEFAAVVIVIIIFKKFASCMFFSTRSIGLFIIGGSYEYFRYSLSTHAFGAAGTGWSPVGMFIISIALTTNPTAGQFPTYRWTNIPPTAINRKGINLLGWTGVFREFMK